MKKHIRIKVKTLLSFALVIIALIMTINFAKENFSSGENPKLTARALAHENNRLTRIFEENDYQLYMMVAIEDGYMLNSNRISSEDATKIYATYEAFKEKFDLYQDYPEYVINTALSQWFSGKATLALEILSGFTGENLDDDIRLIHSAMLIGIADYDNAVKMLHLIQTPEALELKSVLLTFIDSIVGIPVQMSEVIKSSKPEGNYDHLFNSIVQMVKFQEKTIDARMSNTEKHSGRQISGRVTINESPVHGAFLYEKTYNGMSSSVFSETKHYVTDSNGMFVIEEASEDALGVGILISWHLVHDKQKVGEHYAFASPMKEKTVNFEFFDGMRLTEIAVDGDSLRYAIDDPSGMKGRTYRIVAKHSDPKYDINATAYSEKIEDVLAGTVSLKTMQLNSRFAFEFSSSKDALSIDRFMEPLYLSYEYDFSVSAYYENDSGLYVINGFYSDVLDTRMYVKGQDTMSEGDLLIKSGDFEKAIKWYDENRSLHSLKVLKALYTNGYFVKEEKEYWQVLDGADYTKAFEYTKALIDEVGATEDLYLDMGRYLEMKGDYFKALEIYERLTTQYPENQYYHEKYALMRIFTGDYLEGVAYFEAQVTNVQQQFGLSNILILGNQLTYMHDELRSKVERLEGVEAFKTLHGLVEKGAYDRAFEWLNERPNSELKTMYLLIWEDVFRKVDYYPDFGDFIDYYRETTYALSDARIAEVLKYIKLYHNWFN